MKLFLLVVFPCWLSIGYTTAMMCFGRHCDKHKPYCQILLDPINALSGNCVEEDACHGHHHHMYMCHSIHDTLGHTGCCCQDETCIFSTISSVGPIAAVHLQCFGHVCEGHKPTCLVSNGHDITGRCEGAHACDDHFLCSANHQPGHGPHHECCCKTQDCIDGFQVIQPNTTTLTCFGHRCNSHSICLVNKERHNFTGWCEAPEHCHHRHRCTASHEIVHGPEHECCCMDQQCIDNLSSGTTIQHTGTFLTCLGNTCDAHKPYCRLHADGAYLTGICMEERQCMEHHRGICRSILDTHGHEGCCCMHNTCIDIVTGSHHHATGNHTSTSSNTGVYTNGLQCSECSDKTTDTCVHNQLTCGVNEVCKIQHSLQGTVSTRCESIMQCATDKFADAGERQTQCCGSDHCTTNALQNITGSGGHLSCPVCNNQYLGDCLGDHLCAAGDSCMFEAQNGRLSTKCSPNCQQQGSSIICCNDNFCVANTIKHFHQASFVCPRCTDQSAEVCLANTITCSGTNAGCSIIRTANGFTAGCSSSIQDCMAVANNNSPSCALSSPIGDTTQCQSCCQKDDSACIRQALTVHDATTGMPVTVAPAMKTSPLVQTPQPTLGCPPFDLSCPPGCATYDANSCPVCDQSTIDCRATNPTPAMSTVAPVVTSAPKVCVDNDPQNCQVLHGSLCTATDQNIHHLAVVTCAKSCGFCDEYLQIDNTTPPAPPVTNAPQAIVTSTAAPQVTTPKSTTAPKACIDIDPGNCQRMEASLCTTSDPNLHHMAVATCAKTCHLCDEFLLLQNAPGTNL